MPLQGYAEAAPLYWLAGWPSVLPLRPGTKWPPPSGFTGHDGNWPDNCLIEHWVTKCPDWNLALRVPPWLVGLDFDLHKPGNAELYRQLVDRLGPLPPTWRCSSRDDGSGIRLYRVPPGTVFPGDLPLRIGEVVQYHHRYVCAPPSLNPHDNGAPVVWWDPDGERYEETVPCSPEELPELDGPWFDAVLNPGNFDEPHGPHTNGTRPDVPPDQRVAEVLNGALEAMGQPGSRHDTAARASFTLLRLAELEYPGAEDALATLHGRFVSAVTADQSRTEDEAEAEWGRMVRDGRKKIKAEPSTAPHYGDEGPQPADLVSDETDRTESSTSAMIPSWFWQAHPILGHFRTAARAQGRSPDAIFADGLVRLSAAVPYTVELPAPVGSTKPLGLLLELAGETSAGKGDAHRIAGQLLPGLQGEIPLGSGEGLAELFFARVKVTEGMPPEKVQVRHNALVYVDESAAFTSAKGRQGSIVSPTLCTTFTGGTFGQANASADTWRVVPGGSYTVGIVMCIQDDNAGPLLDDAATGTPGRFLWLSSVDPNTPAPKDRPAWPGPIDFELPDEETLRRFARADENGEIRHTMTADQAVLDEIRENDWLKSSGQVRVDPLDGHRDLIRFKVAGLLAILLTRNLHITVEHWRLAGAVVDTSRAVRSQIQERLAYLAAQKNKDRGRADAERSIASEEHRADHDEKAVVRVAQWLDGRLGPEWATGSDLGRGLNSRDRRYRDEALGRLVAVGRAEPRVTSNGRGIDGMEYRKVTP